MHANFLQAHQVVYPLKHGEKLRQLEETQFRAAISEDLMEVHIFKKFGRELHQHVDR